MDYKIIGIVGPIASGKGIVVDYLIKKHHFISFSLSSILHDELKKRGVTSYTRTTLQDLGDELRKKEGDGVLAKRAMGKIQAPFGNAQGKQNSKKIIIEGIRNPGEVEYLRTIPGFFLLAVDASHDIRYKRVLARAKPWDPKDWETFLKVDGRDAKDENNKSGQQVRKCMELADEKIVNNSDIQYVQNEVELKIPL